jgi:hypothetical protein
MQLEIGEQRTLEPGSGLSRRERELAERPAARESRPEVGLAEPEVVGGDGDRAARPRPPRRPLVHGVQQTEAGQERSKRRRRTSQELDM